jgi:hypothetical protein
MKNNILILFFLMLGLCSSVVYAQAIPRSLMIQIYRNQVNAVIQPLGILPQQYFLLNLTNLDNPYIQLN